MNYQECYQMIVGYFDRQVNINNKLLKIKVFNNFISWYKKNYEQELKEYCYKNNQLGILTICKEIKKVLSNNIENLLRTITVDEQFNQFMILSNKIYNFVKESINNHNFNDINYEYYISEISKYENTISTIYRQDYIFYKSECLLDLKYLENKGNVPYLSLRTSRFLSEQN